MRTIHHPITRRTFLKIGAALSIMIASFKYKKAFATPPNSRNQAGYGTGAYGADSYPGNSEIYLPLISKETS